MLFAPNRSKGAGQLVMMQIGLMGIGSGAAAALLFASVTSGSYLSIALFYLAPLPLMIAGLGWSHWSALIGAVAGTTLLLGLFDAFLSLGFLAAAAVPSWVLTHLAMQARPAPAGEAAFGDERSLNWCPPGVLVIAGALLGAGLVLITFPILGLDEATFRASLVRNLSQLTHTDGGSPVGAPGVNDPSRMLNIVALVLPPATAVVATLLNLINLWLAGRIVKFSSRLARPWPQLSTMTFPIWLTIVFAAAIGLTFAGGIVSIAAEVVSASLIVAYGVLGFAVMHEITRGFDTRPFVIGGVYVSVAIFGWPLLFLFLLGVTESAFGIRARAAAKRKNSRKT
jgi:hypothetical protein